jgi:hypothetical protein
MIIIPNKEREDYHSPPSKAEVKTEWIFASSLPFCPLGVYTDNFTSIFTLLFYSYFCLSSSTYPYNYHTAYSR